MTLYALYGPATGDLLTYCGRPIVHTNREEMEWLLPAARVVRVTEQDLAARSPLPPLQLPDHPDLASVQWPLTRDQFRDQTR